MQLYRPQTDYEEHTLDMLKVSSESRTVTDPA
jgi:hypothetical protein